MATTLEAVYCDGWDAAAVNPLTPAAARARDAVGAPYTAVLLLDGRPHAVLDMSWSDSYLRLSRFDAADRQLSRHVLRGTGDGDLFLREARTWHGPPDAGRYEYPHVSARTFTTHHLDGRRTDIVEPRGDLGERHESASVEPPPRVPVPAFGRWHEVLGLAGDAAVRIVDAAGHDLPVRAGPAPWQPPRPYEPEGLDLLFEPGAVVELGGRRVRVSVEAAGPLLLPSGRLVAADPSSLDSDAEPFTDVAPAGAYPVTLSVATFDDEPRHRRVCAARLDIRDRPVARWELALRDGQDPLDLGYREYFGFGVDAGMACFVDVDAADRMRDAWHALDGLVEPRHRTLDAGAMVAWSSGWGDGQYPTWIGRAADGEPVCFLADMLLFPPTSSL